MSYQFELEPLKCGDFERLITKWNLDLPKATDSVDKAGMVRFRGWVLTKAIHNVHVLLKGTAGALRHPIDRARPDVIRTVLGEEPEQHAQLLCGFDVEFRLESDPIQFGFEVDGTEHWLRTVGLRKSIKVVQGQKGYLFLANDSNRSVDQFEGSFPITERNLDRWSDYFENMARYQEESPFHWAFVVAPAKEFLFPEYYPFKRAASTPVDQFRERFARAATQVLCDWDEYETQRELAYSKGDTHWTDYGALIAARQVCRALNLDASIEDSVLFRLETRTGDLGSKLQPPQRFPVYVADFAATAARLVFDNGVTNHGKIHIYENPEAPVAARAVLFGDSFSVNMVRWLSLVFRRIVLVHSAASIDPEVLEIENPQYVIAQTNARFVVSPAMFDLNCRKVAIDKVKSFPERDRSVLKQHLESQPNLPYKAWLIEALHADFRVAPLV